MSSNMTESKLAGEEECEGRESFHIYVLSFVYSLLAALIIGHLVWRWQWRRRKLSRYKSTKPGDKSFKNKHMQKTLQDDFAFIQSLSPDPRLVNKNHPPQNFGECSEGSGVPLHWYRMVVFDAAAEFVATHRTLLTPPAGISQSHPRVSHPHTAHPHTITLPEFLDEQVMKQKLSSRGRLVERAAELYSLARYRDGVFGQDKLQEFRSCLRQLQDVLSQNEGVPEVTLRSPSSSSSSAHPPPASHPHPQPLQYRESLFSYTSQDPLLRMSSCEGAAPDNTLLTDSFHRADVPPTITETATPSHGGHPKKLFGSSKKKKEAILDSELSPLMPSSSAVFSPVSTASSASLDQSSGNGTGLEIRAEATRQTAHTTSAASHSETQV